MLSPVWLQLVPKNDAISIEGLHDIDSNWLSSLRHLNKNVKIGMDL